jgi:hypothetical protein
VNRAVAGLRVQQPSVLWTPPEARFAGRFRRPQNASPNRHLSQIGQPRSRDGRCSRSREFDLGVVYLTTDALPLTIISTLTAVGAGALVMLLVFGFGLDVIGIIGIILLIGIVKKNGITLVDFAREAERSRRLAAEQSIHEACLPRFRPILMTAMCALLGSPPLMSGTGTGSELRQPLGYAMAGLQSGASRSYGCCCFRGRPRRRSRFRQPAPVFL